MNEYLDTIIRHIRENETMRHVLILLLFILVYRVKNISFRIKIKL